MFNVSITCPICGSTWTWNYFKWVWKAPIHWIWFDKDKKRFRDYRSTHCPFCNQRTPMARNLK